MSSSDSQTTCHCLACDPKTGEIGLECRNSQNDCNHIIIEEAEADGCIKCGAFSESKTTNTGEGCGCGMEYCKICNGFAMTNPQTTKWKLVPVEPTFEMADVGDAQFKKYNGMIGTYKAMIDIAPKPDFNITLNGVSYSIDDIMEGINERH